MIEDRPYIIVDNRRIAPIERSSGARRSAVDRRPSDNQPFGVVDRVTISDEAREQLELHGIPADDPPVLPTDPSDRPAIVLALLTYAPKQRP